MLLTHNLRLLLSAAVSINKAPENSNHSFRVLVQQDFCPHFLNMVLQPAVSNMEICSLKTKYIPNINWSDDRVKTDEGLLEVCGCPKDKCKEYAEYCKKVINEVDKK